MNEFIKVVKDGYINIGVILKDFRSILGFEFYYYFMIKNKDIENFKVINLEKGILSVCCEVRNVSFLVF